MVSIDGTVIRQLREQQSLTQLYVAKMVGVTTDTISRWENNRYPTIKRTNAERLAAALEVPVTRIEGVAAAPVQPAAPPHWLLRRNRWLWGLLAATVVLGGGLVWWYSPRPMAQRVLPSYAAPDAVIPVQLIFTGPAVRGVVRETLPTGWTFVAANPAPDSLDEQTGLVRWLVELDQQPLRIHYLVRVGADAELGRMFRFDGELVAHAATGRERRELIGANRLVVSHVHWADLNADAIIDDDEMLEASYLFENMSGLPLDLDEVEAFWIAEHYFWSPEQARFQAGWPAAATNGGED